jgi:hypothetical protein
LMVVCIMGIGHSEIPPCRQCGPGGRPLGCP